RLGELSTQELRSRLLEAADLVESMANGLQGESSDDEADLGYVLDAFAQAVDQLELLEARVAELARQLRGMAEGGQASDVLIALLLQKLMERWGGGQVAEPPRAAVDVEALRKRSEERV